MFYDIYYFIVYHLFKIEMKLTTNNISPMTDEVYIATPVKICDKCSGVFVLQDMVKSYNQCKKCHNQRKKAEYILRKQTDPNFTNRNNIKKRVYDTRTYYKKLALDKIFIAQFDNNYQTHPEYIHMRRIFIKYLRKSCGVRKLSAMNISDIDLLVNECAAKQNYSDKGSYYTV